MVDSMSIVYLISLLILLLALVCSLVRAGLGPTWFDRILAVNAFTTKSILAISVYFFATGHPEYIDIALLYALISYVGALAFVSYFNQNRAPVEGKSRDVESSGDRQ